MPKQATKLNTLPAVVRGTPQEGENEFPVRHYSYSSMALFSSNPLMFKIRYINRDRIDSARNVSGVVGTAFHKAMEVYWGGNDELKPQDEAQAMEYALKTGMEFLDKYQDGWIEYSKTVPTKQKALDSLSFLITSYIKEKPWNADHELLGSELEVNVPVDIAYKGFQLKLPVPLKGFMDKVVREDGKIKIVDYKTCRAFSDPEKIDGKKMLQAVHYYLLCYAYFGEEPYSMVYEEVKASKNRDNSSQVRTYEIVYGEHSLFFDFYFRLYDDITRALSGEAVYVPNVSTFFDNEISIISYIHRLDMSEEQAALMKKHKVDNLTSLLRKQIQEAGNMRKLMKTVEKKFVSARNLNYERMKNEEKIATKLMEHGMMVQFHSKIDGATVDLYRYTPSIGLKMSRMRSFSDDVEQVLGIHNVRVLAPIPGSSLIGFEVPKEDRYFPALPEHDGSFDLSIGQTILGEVKRFDLREAPHMLVAGSTGSGKSVFLNSIIEQLIKTANVELHLFDPKLVELSMYEEHAVQYLSDPKEINDALEDLVIEMEIRYTKMKAAKKRDIRDMDGIPYKVVIIDEFGDLVLNANVSNNVLLLAQKARAAGIHMIVATQRPSVDVISGTIKANFPTKAAFRVAKETDSRVILDETGAEKLAGKGDMLFSTHFGTERLQGFNV